MFDTHTHLIYELDDGARSLDEAEQLIREAAAQGAVKFLATPHYYPDHPTDPEEIRRKAEKLQAHLKQAELPYQVYAGNEILWFESAVEHLRSGMALTLANSSFVLVEFYPTESYQTILKAARKLRGAGYRPVIAHAERYQALRKNGLSELIYQGAYIQISTEPIAGFALHADTRFCRKALKDGEVHFLGTDMHRIDKRPPVLTEALRWIRKNIANAEDVIERNAEHILYDREVTDR